ncbi:MAG: antibiotic biosynthesis monooxygenase family protein [Caldilineaceae bacterium]
MTYVATFQGTATEEHIDTVREAVRILERETQGQPGLIRYEFYQSAENPAIFLLFTIWKSAADLRAHVASDAHKGHVASLPSGAWALPPAKTDWQRLE